MPALLVAAAVSGCTQPLRLAYQPGVQLTDPPRGLNTRRIAVFDFVDDRDEVTPKAFGIEMEMVTAELPIATPVNLEADGVISEYVAAAFRDELKALGMQVTPVNSAGRLDFAAVPAHVVALAPPDVERVIAGRIRFFEWTQAGFAGFAFQAAMPKPRVNAEIQVQVADPTTGRILWAGDGWALERSTSTFPNQAEQATALRTGLLHALEKIIQDKQFLAALA